MKSFCSCVRNIKTMVSIMWNSCYYIYTMPILGGLFKWSEIASKMASGRTDSMCSRRWAQLNEANEVTEYFAKAMKKNALMMPHLSQRGRRRSKTKITVEVSNMVKVSFKIKVNFRIWMMTLYQKRQNRR